MPYRHFSRSSGKVTVRSGAQLPQPVEGPMKNVVTKLWIAALLAFTCALATAAPAGAEGANASGIIATRSAYDMAETVDRLKKDIAAKGTVFFQEIDQADLASKAGIELRPSILLIFGNPPLGIQFVTANQQAGLDWPVRMLVYRDAQGLVWVAYTDFEWIAKRHGIATRDAQFQMATQVAASIASSVARR
jgi:uncharacterized protein (DUF302 family)